MEFPFPGPFEPQVDDATRVHVLKSVADSRPEPRLVSILLAQSLDSDAMSLLRLPGPVVDLMQRRCSCRATNLVAGLLILVFGLCQTDYVAGQGSAPLAGSRPNIILINLDDADWSMFEADFDPGFGYRYFPNIAKLADQGMRFTNFHVTTPICGPSRACLLTGQYAHKVGILCNQPEHSSSRGLPGGYDVWKNSGPEGENGPKWLNENIGVWLQDAGYRTMMVGKYLHSGFEPSAGETWADYAPPGWDESYISLGSVYHNVYQVVNGLTRQTKNLNPAEYPSRYRTDVEATDALRLITEHQATSAGQPFLLYFAPLTPHREDSQALNLDENLPEKGMIAPKYRSWWPGMIQRFAPDFNEWDMSDKPRTLSDLDPLDVVGTTWRDSDLVLADVEYRRRSLSMKSADDFVKNLLQKIDDLGIRNNTIIIFTSDNGYQLGHHRLFGKGTCFDRASRVPLLVWGPGQVMHRPEELKYLMAHIDIAPTLLEMAGVNPPVALPGKSFVPLLEMSYPGLFRDWRPQGVLLEHWQLIAEGRKYVQSTMTGIRMFDSVFLEWATGEQEFYDMRADPWQLENQADELFTAEKEYYQNLITLQKLDIVDPVSNIETPFGPAGTGLLEETITGTAEYSSDVSEVRLTIRDVTSGQGKFWNGSSWQTGYTTVQAELESVGLTLVNWSYKFRPPFVASSTRFYVGSRAYAANGKYQPVPDSTILTIETTQPFGLIERPYFGATLKKNTGLPIPISGWASDGRGLKLVRLVIRHNQTGKFWNGSAWQTAAVTFAVDSIVNNPGTHHRWSYNFNPQDASGDVNIILRMVSEASGAPVKTISSRMYWVK